MQPDGPPEVVGKPSTDCKHEGLGPHCIKCGVKYQDKGAGKCDKAMHERMHDLLGRKHCTFCGLDLSTITAKEV